MMPESNSNATPLANADSNASSAGMNLSNNPSNPSVNPNANPNVNPNVNVSPTSNGHYDEDIIQQHDLHQLQVPLPSLSFELDASTPTSTKNENLLSLAFVSFAILVVLQMIVASIANSKAMVGDSAAMAVDLVTYLFNFFAEKKKNSLDLQDEFIVKSPSSQDATDNAATDATTDINNNDNNNTITTTDKKNNQQLIANRKTKISLELFPPLFSVTVLISVNTYILQDAIRTLTNGSDNDEPNVVIMFVFAILNLAVDFLNMCCFTKSDDHFVGLNAFKNHDDDDAANAANVGNNNNNGNTGEKKRFNLNMFSAFTHVFADTLRSIAVLVASTISIMSGSSPEKADAIAAIFVSLIIVFTLVPLFQGLKKTWAEFVSIRKGEQQGQGGAHYLERNQDGTMA